MTTPSDRATPSRAALYRSERFREHDTGTHPENARRLIAIDAALERGYLLAGRPEIPFTVAPDEALARVHDRRYIAGLRNFAEQGGGWLDADTWVGPSSVEIAALAAGAGIAAIDAALSGAAPRGFVLARPPGHHATPGRGMGFCLFNTIAVAAEHALAEGIERVLIVDWDVHHGNGTQEAFYADARVAFLSSHRWPFYPGTGDAHETGTGEGLGLTLNLPISFGTPRETYLERFAAAFDQFAAKVRPQLVLISAGFDSHRADPIGSLGLETEDFAELTRVVCAAAATYADGRVVSLLEGGYNPPVLAECVETHLRGLLGDY